MAPCSPAIVTNKMPPRHVAWMTRPRSWRPSSPTRAAIPSPRSPSPAPSATMWCTPSRPTRLMTSPPPSSSPPRTTSALLSATRATTTMAALPVPAPSRSGPTSSRTSRSSSGPTRTTRAPPSSSVPASRATRSWRPPSPRGRLSSAVSARRLASPVGILKVAATRP